MTRPNSILLVVTTAVSAALLVAVGAAPSRVPEVPEPASVIVQARDTAAAAAAVRGVGGTLTHELGIIDSVAARLTPGQLEQLGSELASTGRVYQDHSVRATGKKGGGSNEPSPPVSGRIGADLLHDINIDGKGVTIAVVDTGLYSHPPLTKNPSGKSRVLANYDAILDQEYSDQSTDTDESGHGAHVASIALDSTDTGTRQDPEFWGIAPKADLVVVRAFDRDGRGSYADVIRGIDWVVQRADEHYIRVLNLSFSAPVSSHYWEDPLNQAVMRAWAAGIVVVASAGNGGPDPMSIGVPGNVPYVVTVGAMTDQYTPEDGTDDRLASFSATGPTYEGFVKPDVVAPGGHIVALMNKQSRIPVEHPEFHDGGHYFQMSGTSQSAAVVTGVAALIIQNDPSYTPDDVKCALMTTARAASNPDGTSPYSVFQQGAGLVNAYDAVLGGYRGCANGGLDVTEDLAGIEHYGGPAMQDEAGSFYLLDEPGDGTTWDGTYNGSDGYPWSNGYPWSSGYPWSNGYSWSNGYTWSNGYPWTNGVSGSESLEQILGESLVESDPISEPSPPTVNPWVPQE